jgi:RNA polymerase sigma factor (sigma-70 family)
VTKQQLIEDNMRLVYSLVSKEYPTYLTDEDIIQCGMLGLCKAAEKWDEGKSKFSTFAISCIRNEIRYEFRKRAKHQGILSLDYEVDTEEGTITVADMIPGDEDVCYLDYGINVNKLKPREKRVFELLQGNMTHSDIGRELGISTQAVWSITRKLRKMRG